MPEKLLVRGIKQLITVQGPPAPRRGAEMSHLGVIRDGAMLIEDGIISQLGPASRVENLKDSRGAEVLNAYGKVVMPGFVDPHTHLVFGPPRLDDYEMSVTGVDYADIADAGGGILSSVRAVRGISSRRLILEAQARLKRFALAGTTTLEAKSGYGLDEGSEMKTLRIIERLNGHPLTVLPTFLGAHAVPPEYKGRADDYIEMLCTNLLPKVAKRKLARFADVYCDRNAFTVEQARRYCEAAIRLGLQVRMHASQHESTGAVALALELGAMSVDHLENASADEIRMLGRTNTVATLLPGSVFHMGLKKYAPAKELLRHGAALALATDFNPGTSPTVSMPMILSLACTQMGMSPGEAIVAATINAAAALGLQKEIGTLEYGKRADFVILDAGDYREIPYYFGMNLVSTVVKGGKVIVDKKELRWPED